MLRSLCAVLFLMPTTIVYAEGDCGGDGSALPLSIVTWAARLHEPTATVTVALKNQSSRNIRAVNGIIDFEDPFGRDITFVEIPEGTDVLSGNEEVVTIEAFSHGFDEVQSLDHADVVVTACTAGLVYDDGTKEIFK